MQQQDSRKQRGLITEHVLLAIPIVVLLLAIAFSPHPSKGFLTTITSKPEWYFLALVFCIEAHRDREKIVSKTRGSDNMGIIFMTIATVLSAFAAGASVAPVQAAFFPSPANSGELATWWEVLLSQVQTPLQLVAIPIFLFSACWCFFSKRGLRIMEDEEADQLRVLTASNTHVYPIGRKNSVRKFYDAVASEYNKRNDKTKGVRDASNQVVESIRNLSYKPVENKRLSVLDLGGGTGHNIYNLLRSVGNLDWMSVDLSPRMTEKFRENFPDVKAITADCSDLSKCLAEFNQTFDVIILCFSLSSMIEDIDLKDIHKTLNVGGILLIADIHPGYITKSPRFDIEIGAQTHALELRKVEPLILEYRAREAQMVRSDWHLFKNERGEVYSFVLKFDRVG